MIALLVAFALLQPMRLGQIQVTPDQVQTVCSIVEYSDFYDGKTVSVESSVLADVHSVLLEGKPCGRGIYVLHESGRKNGRWPDFDRAIARKAAGLDRSPLVVKLKGIYHAKVPYRGSTIRQLEIVDVMDVSSHND